MEKETKIKSVLAKHYIIAFWICLILSIGLIITGFFTPPLAEISGSVITAVGEIFLYPALAFGAKALEEGRTAKLQVGNKTISVGDKEE